MGKIKQKPTNWLSMRAIFLWVALLSGVLLALLAFRYQSEGVKFEATKRIVDAQIARVNGFTADYLQGIQGSYSHIDNISSEIKNYERDQRLIQSGGVELADLGNAQKAILSEVSADWQTMKSYLDEVLNAQETLKTVRESIIEISNTELKLSVTLRELRRVLPPGSSAMLSRLNEVNFTSSGLLSLSQKILIGGSEAKSAAENIDQKLMQFLNSMKTFDELLETYPMKKEQKRLAKEVNLLLGTIKSQFAQLTGFMPQYIQTSNLTSDLDRHSIKLVGALHDLKNSYNKSNLHPVKLLPLNYTVLMVLLLAITILSLTAWTFFQTLNENHLRMEAEQLRKEVEQKNRRDQEAIVTLMDELKELSNGDLTIEAQSSESNIGAIADSVNYTIESMRELVGTIKNTSTSLGDATDETQNLSQLLLESAQRQSKQIATTSETAAYMTATLDDVVTGSEASVDIARSSVEIAKKGRERVNDSIKNMGNIRENIQDTAKRIKRLGESSQEIGDIIVVMRDIADQTNMLSLNAAIQASAAGEAGRGFAVVADEVQRLAEHSTNQAKAIEKLILTIQADAKEAALSMENSTEKVVKGAEISLSAGKSLARIEEVSENLANLIIKMSSTVKSASDMASGVMSSMSVLKEITRKSSKNTRATVDHIDSLQTLSNSLEDSVEGFKLPQAKRPING